MTLLPNKWQQPYHTSVEHTAPHRRGGANQEDHRSHSTGGGGDEAKQEQTGKATSPNKTTTHLTGKGGYHGEGGEGGCGSPASYMCMCVCVCDSSFEREVGVRLKGNEGFH